MTSPDIKAVPDLLHNLTESDHASWKWSVPGLQYRGEGNANLVVATNGTYKVPRLPKSKSAEKYQLEKLIGVQNYINIILLPHLGDYVDPVHAVKLSHDQLLDIKSLVDKLRPSKRHSKYVFYPAALLMTDHCLLSIISESPTLSIEIKLQ